MRAVRQHWEDIGTMDPLWGVLSKPGGQFGGWDHEDFFATGEREIESLMTALELLDRPARHVRALDFGCGVGRLTRALAGRFEEVCGVDVSEPMVLKARELNAGILGCKFMLNHEDNLRSLPDRHFDLAYTRIVLQHLGSRDLIKAYIAELVRVVREDGILVFGAITHIPVWRRLKLRHRAYMALRALGVGRGLLYEHLRLMPYTAIHIPEQEIEDLIEDIDARILRVEKEPMGRSGVESHMFYVASRPRVPR